jgi:hypothetical protein
MAEFTFVVKTFFISCLFLLAMQYKVKGVSAESQIFAMIKDNRVSGWLNDVGTGAVRVTASVADKVLPESIKQSMNEKAPTREDMIKQQQEQLQKQEQEWAQRVEKAVDGL